MKHISLLLSLVVSISDVLGADRPLPTPLPPTPAKQQYAYSFRGQIPGKVERIVLPEMEFTGSHLTNVLAVLQQASVANDHDGDTRKGMVIVLAPELQARANDLPKVTLVLPAMVLGDVVKLLSNLLGVSYWTTDTMVVFGKTDTEVQSRMYDLLPNAFATISGNRTEDDADRAALVYFERLGIRFPAGTGVGLIPQIDKVVVRNTRNELDLFEKVLGVINVVPTQIETGFRLVEILEPSTVLTNQILDICTEDALTAKGQLDLLLDATLVSQTGSRATNFVHYSTPDMKAASPASCMASFVVQSGVSPDGMMIHLTVESTMAMGGKTQFQHHLMTTLAMENGSSMIFWLNNRSDKQLLRRYLRISSRLVDLRGHPILPLRNLAPLIPAVHQAPKP